MIPDSQTQEGVKCKDSGDDVDKSHGTDSVKRLLMSSRIGGEEERA